MSHAGYTTYKIHNRHKSTVTKRTDNVLAYQEKKGHTKHYTKHKVDMEEPRWNVEWPSATSTFIRLRSFIYSILPLKDNNLDNCSKLCTTFLKIAKHYKTVAVRLRLIFQFTFCSVLYRFDWHVYWLIKCSTLLPFLFIWKQLSTWSKKERGKRARVQYWF